MASRSRSASCSLTLPPRNLPSRSEAHNVTLCQVAIARRRLATLCRLRVTHHVTTPSLTLRRHHVNRHVPHSTIPCLQTPLVRAHSLSVVAARSHTVVTRHAYVTLSRVRACEGTKMGACRRLRSRPPGFFLGR